MPTPQDPIVSARKAGLRYVNDQQPGIRRKVHGQGFTYIHPNGQTVKAAKTKERITSLAIPPAYTDVWICANPKGHIQATGLDERERKQYIYHPLWQKVRDETKFSRLVVFGNNLPRIRRRIQKDFKQRGLPKQKVLATLLQLLEKTHIRIGNKTYAEENGSYGLTTLRNKHVDIKGSEISFNFVGKRGIKHEVDLRDPRLAYVVRKLHDLPGQDLFQYQDEYGITYSITSTDVNNYLQEITDDYFSAKDFRTWKATVLACDGLLKTKPADSTTEAKRTVAVIVENVADQLGNTPAICRKAYIYPPLLEDYIANLSNQYLLKHQKKAKQTFKNLRQREALVMTYISANLT